MSKKMTSTKDLLSYLIGQKNTLSTNKLYIRFCGGHGQALLFSQLWFYMGTKLVEQNNGWLYRTYEEWENEICVGRRTVKSAATQWEEWGMLKTKFQKVGGVPKIHYQFDIEQAINLLEYYAPYYKWCENQGVIPKSFEKYTELCEREVRGVQNCQVEVCKTATSRNCANCTPPYIEILLEKLNREFKKENVDSPIVDSPENLNDNNFERTASPIKSQSDQEKENVVARAEILHNFEDVELEGKEEGLSREEFEIEARELLRKSSRAVDKCMKELADVNVTREQVVQTYIDYAYEKQFELRKSFANGLKAHAANIKRNNLAKKRKEGAAKKGAKPSYTQEKIWAENLHRTMRSRLNSKEIGFCVNVKGEEIPEELTERHQEAVLKGLVGSMFTYEEMMLYIAFIRFNYIRNSQQYENGVNFVWMEEDGWRKWRTYYKQAQQRIERLYQKRKKGGKVVKKYHSTLDWYEEVREKLIAE